MRIVVHAGLHKSGTTTVQAALHRAYGTVDPASGTWYPDGAAGFGPNHAAHVWPFLAATQGSAQGDRPERPLAEIVRDAEARGVRTLILDTEELARLREGDVPGLLGALGRRPAVIVVTVTTPVHRWAAGWQELPKAGHPGLPAAHEEHLAETLHLRTGALAAFLVLLPAARRIVRVVRTDPPEPDLPARIADLLGVPPPTIPEPARNRGLGTHVELVRRLNAAGLPAAPDPDRAHARAFALLAPAWRTRPGRPRDPAAWLPPAWLPAAAAAERDHLLAPPDGVVVEDPHGLLAGWADARPPAWMTELATGHWWPPLRERPSAAEVRWLVRWYRVRRTLARRLHRRVGT